MATTVSLARWPVSAIAIARIARIWSPSTSLPSWSTARQRSASPSRAKPASAPCSRTAACSGPRWVEPQPSLMLRPSGSAPIAMTSAPACSQGVRTGVVRRAVGAVEDDLEPGERPARWCRGGGRRTPSTGVAYGVTRPTSPPVGRSQSSSRCCSICLLDGVVELEAAAGEELDAVVGHRVVRGADDDAEVGAERLGQVGDPRGRQHPQAQHVDPGRREAGDDGVLEELPGDPGVPAHDRERPVALELAAVGEHPGRGDRQVERELRGQLTVGQTADPVGAEDPRHAQAADQRLLNCGALRAFLRPAFLRSMTRASRVSSPAFLSDGRLASTSIALRQRATPRRSAPA